MDLADMAELGCMSEACIKALEERGARKEFQRNAWSDLWIGGVRVPRSAPNLDDPKFQPPFTPRPFRCSLIFISKTPRC